MLFSLGLNESNAAFGLYPFLIETKHYKGWIHGGENLEYWTQTIYNHKNKFRNPIKQNAGHIRAVRNILREYPQAVYHTIVAFTGSAELKNVYSSVPVVYGWELRRTILERSGTPCLSAAEVEAIAEKLSTMSRPDKAAKKSHVRHARSQAHRREQTERSLVCPRCGAELVLRRGRHGSFYGCARYPGCKYTLNG